MDVSEYRIASFAPGFDGDRPDAATTAWFNAVDFGFHGPRSHPEVLLRQARAASADGRVLTGMWQDSVPDHAWDASIPVATYTAFPGNLNVGDGVLLDAHIISDVTVRPTHRRHGLLRHMMTADLAAARAARKPVALLTASEAAIYGRFGFGAATFIRSVNVDTSARFRLAVPTSGRVEMAHPEELPRVGRDVFARFHEVTRGSVSRHHGYEEQRAGLWSDGPDPDPHVRLALHYDPSGRIDGFCAYRVSGEYHHPQTVDVTDLIAATPQAYLQLWEFLGSLDLVGTVRFTQAPMDDPLPWALADRRAYSVTAGGDRLWVRILDPVAALEARPWRGDGEVTLAVSDALGLSDGVYHLSVADGTARVETRMNDDDADIRLDIAALGSLYLGGANTRTLAAIGVVRPSSDDALAGLAALADTAGDPYCATFF